MKKLLYATISGIDGNDYTFYYYNGVDDVDDLIRHIKNEFLISCVDEYGDPSGSTVSFIKQNIIRVRVKEVDVKVKQQVVTNVASNDDLLINVTNDLLDSFINILTTDDTIKPPDTV
jgi:hypothetical protein